MTEGFDGMTDDQVVRVWVKLQDRAAGWDWPTLRVCRPGLCNSVKRVREEIGARVAVNGSFFGIPGAKVGA